jgi:thiol:disulfide interchange protein DsbC
MHKPLFLLIALLSCFFQSALADELSVKKIVEERISGISVDSVQKTPFFGLYEVRAGRDLFYTDEQATYLLLGNVLDGRTLENLTAARTREINAVVFNQLPFNQAIAIVHGKGTRKMAYFADPLCGYCKQLDRSLAKLDDVTVYVFMYPVLSADSLTLSRAVWCSSNPAGAWTNLMVNGIQPKAKSDCSAEAVERNRELGQRLKIYGTPSLVFENNVRMDGALPIARLDQLLNEGLESRKKTSSK